MSKAVRYDAAILAVALLAALASGQTETQPGDDVERFAVRLSSLRPDERARAVDELARAPARALPILRALLGRDVLTAECDFAIRDCLKRLGTGAAELLPDVEHRLAKMPADAAAYFDSVLIDLGADGVAAYARRYPITDRQPWGAWSALQSHATRNPDAMAFVLRGLVHEDAKVREHVKRSFESFRANPPKHANAVWARLAGATEPALRAECIRSIAGNLPLRAEDASLLARSLEAHAGERLDGYRLLARAGAAGIAELRRVVGGEDRGRSADSTVALLEAGAEPEEEAWRRLADENEQIRAAAVACLGALGAAVVPRCKEHLVRGELAVATLQIVARLGAAAAPLEPELVRITQAQDAVTARLAARILAELRKLR